MILNFLHPALNLILNLIFACATCFGDKNAETAKALNYAILSLLGLTGSMLASIVGLFVYIFKKKKK